MGLFIVAGHGNGDSGACGFGFQEQERVRALGYRLKALGGDEVILGDFSKNYYAQNLIGTIPKGHKVLELHMDSASASAKGGHVIIDADLSADTYDNALASFVASFFPGRSTILDKRNNLANLNRAVTNKLNYRLLECCFISNEADLNKFNTYLDDFAKGILSCFGIGASSTPTPAPTPTVTPTVTPSDKISEDGKWGTETTKKTQNVLGTFVDGIVSNQIIAYKKYMPNALTSSWRFESKKVNGSAMIKALQKLVGAKVDGIMGIDTIKALQRFLGVVVDGIMGTKTVIAWQIWLNKQ